MITQVKLTARSSNRKTGPIATTISSSNTCPTTCPFNKGGGCYAAGGPTAIHWRKLDRRETGTPIGDFGHQLADAKLAPGSLLRWNVAGDLPHHDGTINLPVLQQLVGTMVWGAKLRPFTYTHHVQTVDNLDAVKWCNGSGFTVNLSCDLKHKPAGGTVRVSLRFAWCHRMMPAAPGLMNTGPAFKLARHS